MDESCIVKGVSIEPTIRHEHDSCCYELRRVTKHNARQVELILNKCGLLTAERIFPKSAEWHKYFDYSYLVIYFTFSVASIVCKKVSNEVIVEAIAVLDNFRNRGLAKFMLTSLLGKLSSDIQCVSARVEDGCSDLRGLFLSCGFKEEKDGLFKIENGTTDGPTQ